MLELKASATIQLANKSPTSKKGVYRHAQPKGLARALIAGPDVIFADEPTGNLDSRSGAEVMKMLGDIRRRMNKTLVVITHDSRIAQMAERRLVIMDGILTEEGVAGR